MSSQPFDLEKVDYEKQRRLVRRKFIRRSAPAVVIVILLILWFGPPTPLTYVAIKHYDKGSYKSSRNWLAPLTIAGPEPFVIAYNSGTVDTKLGNYERAEAELSRAVSIAPPDKLCMAAQNLGNALQSHAKSVKESDSKKASELRAKLQKVIKKYPDCFPQGGGGGGGGGSSGVDSQNDAPTESQQEALKQKEQAGRDRKAEYANEEKFDADKPNVKRW